MLDCNTQVISIYKFVYIMYRLVVHLYMLNNAGYMRKHCGMPFFSFLHHVSIQFDEKVSIANHVAGEISQCYVIYDL